MNFDYKRLDDEESVHDIEKYSLSWMRLHQCKAKLGNTSEMASLMSFFAVVAAVELKLVSGETSENLIIALTVTTSSLVGVTMLVKSVTCSLMPYLESVIEVSEIRDVVRSPHEEMILLINVTWLLATIVSPALFVIDLIVMTWIHFKFFTAEAVYGAMLILVPLLIIILGFGVVLVKQTMKPDKTCAALSKSTRAQIVMIPKNQKFVVDKSRNWRHSDRSSESILSISDKNSTYWEWNENEALLLNNPFPMYTSYGSVLPTNPILYYRFLD